MRLSSGGSILRIRPADHRLARWEPGTTYIANQFAYKFAWGLSAMTMLSLPPDTEPSTAAWGAIGVPPAAMWIKDLVTWGTLDPVAAYALSLRLADARPDAEALAMDYYNQLDSQELGDPLDPAAIQAWAASVHGGGRAVAPPSVPSAITVRLSARIADGAELGRWRVVPLVRDHRIDWADVAGYVLAASELLAGWDEAVARDFDFVLDPVRSVIESARYL